MEIKKFWLFNEADPSNFEAVTNMPSMTVPDLNLTINQILSRFTAGYTVDGVTNDVYDVPDGVDEETAAEVYQRYDDNPDNLTLMQEIENVVREVTREKKESERKARESAAPARVTAPAQAQEGQIFEETTL